MARANEMGKALGFRSRDEQRLARHEERLGNALRALDTLEEIGGPVGDLRRDAEEMRDQCRKCRQAFFEAGEDASGLT